MRAQSVEIAGQCTCPVPYAKQVIILDLDTFEQRGTIESEYFSRPSQVRGFARIGRRESTSSDPHGLALNRDGSKLYITVQYAEVPGVVVYDVEAEAIKKIDTVIAGNYLWFIRAPTNSIFRLVTTA